MITLTTQNTPLPKNNQQAKSIRFINAPSQKLKDTLLCLIK